MDVAVLVGVMGVVVVGVVLLVRRAVTPRGAGDGARDLRRVGEGAGSDPGDAAAGAAGSTAWMRGGGGGL